MTLIIIVSLWEKFQTNPTITGNHDYFSLAMPIETVIFFSCVMLKQLDTNDWKKTSYLNTKLITSMYN